MSANCYGAAGFDVGFVWGVEWGGFREGWGERKAPSLCCKRGAQLIISIRLDAAEHTHTHAHAYYRERDVKTGNVLRDELLH